jgi:hypothetical protein
MAGAACATDASNNAESSRNADGAGPAFRRCSQPKLKFT